MNAERWRQVDATFEAVREAPSGAWPALLTQLCRDDAALRREVETLLEAEAQLANEELFLAQPLDAEQVSSLAEPIAGPGAELAGFRLLEVLGRGGGGIVYRAAKKTADAAAMPEVALKVGWARLSKKEGARFRREQEILSRLVHPGIVSFFELDSTADGQPYLAMELVEGAPIDRHCDERQLTITQRLELFDQLCGAVFYLHRQGIVHRDLKPSNVLVARDGRVKLLDFGIAKALDSGTFHTRLDPTESKIHLITPGYCSPEQVRVKRVTPASDVYSLAVLLFELLVGAAPYRFESSSPQLLDILQAVYQRPPCSLGEILELAAGSRRRELELCRQRGVGSLAELRRQLPPALEAALAVAFAQDPAARPPHAGALAKLIRQALDSSLGARLRRLGRRMLPAAAPRRPKKT